MAEKDFKSFKDVKSYRYCKFENIKEDILKNHPEYKDTINTQIKNKTSFLTIKRAYYQTYYPGSIPEKKAPKEPMSVIE